MREAREKKSLAPCKTHEGHTFPTNYTALASAHAAHLAAASWQASAYLTVHLTCVRLNWNPAIKFWPNDTLRDLNFQKYSQSFVGRRKNKIIRYVQIAQKSMKMIFKILAPSSQNNYVGDVQRIDAGQRIDAVCLNSESRKRSHWC